MKKFRCGKNGCMLNFQKLTQLPSSYLNFTPGRKMILTYSEFKDDHNSNNSPNPRGPKTIIERPPIIKQ